MWSIPTSGFGAPVSDCTATARLAMFLAMSPIRLQIGRRSSWPRRSRAGRRPSAGACAISRIACSSTSSSSLSTISSASMVRAGQVLVVRLQRDDRPSFMSFSAWPPICVSLTASAFKLIVIGGNDMFRHDYLLGRLFAGQSTRSAEAAGDVVAGCARSRVGEDLLRSPTSTRMPRWKNAVRCDTRAACCMLCVTMTMRSVRAARRSAPRCGGGDRVERRARLVHQDHLGLDRDGAGDAQALLLAARQAVPAVAGGPSPRPTGRRCAGSLDDLVQFGLACARPWMRGP